MTPTNPSEQQWYSRRDLAKLFSCTPQSIIRWEAAGLLTGIHFNSGTIRFHHAEVAAFVDRQKIARPTKGAHRTVTA